MVEREGGSGVDRAVSLVCLCRLRVVEREGEVWTELRILLMCLCRVEREKGMRVV